jgi:hypothetical protein
VLHFKARVIYRQVKNMEEMNTRRLMEGNWIYGQFRCTKIGILETGVAGGGGRGEKGAGEG